MEEAGNLKAVRVKKRTAQGTNTAPKQPKKGPKDRGTGEGEKKASARLQQPLGKGDAGLQGGHNKKESKKPPSPKGRREEDRTTFPFEQTVPSRQKKTVSPRPKNGGEGAFCTKRKW